VNPGACVPRKPKYYSMKRKKPISLSDAYNQVLYREGMEDPFGSKSNNPEPITSAPAGPVYNDAPPSPGLPDAQLQKALGHFQQAFKELKEIAKKQAGFDQVDLKNKLIELTGGKETKNSDHGIKLFDIVTSFIRNNKDIK